MRIIMKYLRGIFLKHSVEYSITSTYDAEIDYLNKYLFKCNYYGYSYNIPRIKLVFSAINSSALLVK